MKDSRPQRLAEIQTIKRRRQCARCQTRFATFELPESVVEAVEAELATFSALKKAMKDAGIR